ncbi:hypothetical protein PPERSA_07173 [Pseudocohnilembus persalinus]|uniref:Uncharacterized protein n=1 Tax=Pseudocohnilembus persalinus TaxID=266149 RepID=A0A0V0QXQ8_PSEPJ|nr:hypothetical protein PPERSA_07173 [Pseudocohnilembus persalinus]|eukprot:KRX07010.1 hypothetical protein PPERSA_07173 [Pseudocohnilembus persalinus]
MIEIYKTQDIKGIQFDTLGFLFLNFGLTNQMADYSEIQDLVVKALSYYAENLRECKMSMSTAIKNNNFDQLKEVIEWDSWVDRSYLRLLYNFLKYQNQTQILNKKGLQYDINTDYFLEQITEGLKDQKNLTFNIDMKQIQPIYANILNKDSQFYKNFVGGYQNFNYLKFHVQRQKLQKILFRILNNSEKDEELSKEGQEILEDLEKNILPQIKVENAYDLSGFSLYNKPEHLTKYSHNQNNDLQAKNINQIYQLDLQYFSIENLITKFLIEMTKFGAKTLDLIVNLEQIFDKIKLEIGKIFEQFNQDIDQLNLQQVVFPFELHYNLSKFYQDTFRFLQIFSLQSETVKSKLSKFSKKPSKEKKQITAVLKSFLAFFPDLQEQSNTLAQKLLSICDKYCADYLDKNSKNEDNLYNLIKISNEEKALKTQNGQHISIGDVFNKIEQISFSKVIDQTLYEKSKLNYSFLLKNLVQLVKAQGKEIVVLK